MDNFNLLCPLSIKNLDGHIKAGLNIYEGFTFAP